MSAYRCPFYGFSSPSPEFPALMDSAGNQCALVADSLSPCQMEKSGQTPNWEECPIKQQQGAKILELMQKVRVYPSDSHPQAICPKGGIPFGEWKAQVMAGP